MPLNRDQILALAGRRETRTVDVPGFGEFTLREMSGTDRDAYQASLFRYEGDQTVPVLANIRAKLVSYCLVDESGERIFTSAPDVSELGKLPSRVLERLADVASEMNGLGDEDIEKLAGNSEAAQSGASTSD